MPNYGGTRRALMGGAGTGPNLLVNGDFLVDDSGWTPSAADQAVVSGELQITTNAAAVANTDSTPFATTPGRTYAIGYTGRRGTSSSAGVSARSQAGTSLALATLLNTTNVNGLLFFVATTATSFVRLSAFQAVIGRTAFFDNITAREIS